MQNFIYHMPVKVYFEEKGVSKYLPQEMKKYGKNIMIVYGGGSVKRNGVLDELKAVLKDCGKNVFEFGGVASSPSYEKIQEGTYRFCAFDRRTFQYDCLWKYRK